MAPRGHREPRSINHAEDVMGTVVSFCIYPGDLAATEVTAALGRACQLLHHVDRTFSTFKPESPISRLRGGQVRPEDMPSEVTEVLGLCRQAKVASGGWFDPWAVPGGVDPSGLVKGWAAQRSLAVLSRAGVPAAMVNAGGDVAVSGRPTSGDRWRIGIRHPWRADALACILEVDESVATSGTYERGAHLVNPYDRLPAVTAASATVTGPSLAMADAMATALAVAGPEHVGLVAALDGYGAYVIGADGSEVTTDGIVFADPT